MAAKMKTVLHLSEAFGGGVETAICSYIQSTENLPIHHCLLARKRDKNDIGLIHYSQFKQIEMIDGNLLTFYLRAKHFIDKNKPDIIHLHSSFAGFIGRFLPKYNGKIVYTPHCYAFERLDISFFMRKFFIFLESINLSNIDVIAGCSLRECELAKKLNAKQTIYLNNYANLNKNTPTKLQNKRNIKAHSVIKIAVIGRVCPQKDPQFLIETIKHFQKHKEYQHTEFHWIGGGDLQAEQELKNAGVKVTGMLNHQQVIENMLHCDLYIHTAAWEGMPLTILEAAALNIPIILRIIGATQNMPYPFLVSTPKNMAKQIITFISHASHQDYYSSLHFFNDEFSQEKQRQALIKLYLA